MSCREENTELIRASQIRARVFIRENRIYYACTSVISTRLALVIFLCFLKITSAANSNTDVRDVEKILNPPLLESEISEITNNFTSRSSSVTTTVHLLRRRTKFEPPKDPMWTNRLIFAGLYGILFLLGLANVLVLFIVSRYRRMRTVTNILVFNLCLADLVYISFLPIVIMVQLLRDWMFGTFVCKLFFIAESTAKYASVYFVCILSLDRYLAMCHPHWCKRYRKPTLALSVSAIGWLVTAFIMMPIYLYSAVYQGPHGLRVCTVIWPRSDDVSDNNTQSESSEMFENFSEFTNESTQQRSSGGMPTMASFFPKAQIYFVIMSFLFCFGIPALVILFFYFKVVDQLMQASNRAERLKKKREKTYRKVTRMVLAVITCYVLCWSPYWIQFMTVTFLPLFELSNALKIFFNIIHLFPYLNCAINPILYSLMTENFRRILIELFPCSSCCCCEKRGQIASANAIVRRPNDRRRSTSAAELERLQNGGGLFAAARGAFGGRRIRKTSACPRSPYDIIDEDDDDCDTKRLSYVRPSISQSIRLVSEFSLNLLAIKSPRTSTIESGYHTETTL